MKSINILGDRNLTLANIQEMRHTGTTRTYYVSDDGFALNFLTDISFLIMTPIYQTGRTSLKSSPFRQQQLS